MARPEIKLDPINHRYTVNGLPVAGVTSVIAMLANWEGVPPDVLKAAGERGTAVHAATELDDEDDLDDAALAPSLVPYINAWRKFKTDAGLIITSSEQQVYNARHAYAGTYDRTGYLSALHDDHCLIDIKTTAALAPYVGLQTAAYAEAWNKSKQPGADKIKRRYAVQLKSDGRYSLQEYSDKSDLAVFLNLLSVHNWRRGNEKNYLKMAG